ncbi:hypothetical protein TVAG_240500 [Trichomonas vaginalis G3]|uniref:Uncharacterized protein n=1 Tax=Trichomonas vaginalis (strain ATCC PRA-98 / G3) TaxID=412133 RepID=A2EJ97_TRIV3|nr:hypothetical protein TVAGG3_0315010 [Trichomonas vaginalis G3]EAY07249.1 hypothetical protein TVAG_240500 [Trichomonas vaginalis G3]KAI5528890.1 hypothetical protein TVAGG3_0315010 [Trichomonas vaginalis G3]|eukprot:XP_001319472.1 hypothetical protein [Trichomonas vaginalis G3]
MIINLNYLWALEIYSCCFFGYQFTTLLTHRFFGFFTRLAIGLPIGLISFAWLILIVSYFIPMTNMHAYLALSTFGLFGIILKFLNRNIQFKVQITFDYFHRWAVILCSFFLTLAVYSANLAGDRYSKGAAYSDLPFHLNIITSFSYGPAYRREEFYKIDSPFYHGKNLAYPLIPDFLSAALVTTGDASLQKSLFFPSEIMMLSLVIAVYQLTNYILKDEFQSVMSLLIFMTTGGLAFVLLFDKTKQWDEHERCDFIHHWTNDFDGYWFQTLMHLLLPQRSSLFAVPLCFWTIYLLIHAVKLEDFRLMFLASLITGYMPQVQAHAYMAIAQWSITYAIITFPYLTREKWKRFFFLWLLYGVVANAMAIPQLPPFFQRISIARKSFLQIEPVYKRYGKGIVGFYKTWWLSLGVFAFGALIGGWAEANTEQIVLYIPSLVVFFIANFVRYQDWLWDNIKIYYDGWMPIALPFATQFIFGFYNRYKRGERPILNKMTFFALLFMTCCSGTIHCIFYLSTPAELYSTDKLKFGKWVAENTRVNDVFVNDDSHEQSPSSLGGRISMLGFSGWIETHGLDYYGRRHHLHLLRTQPENVLEYDKENIWYLFQSDESSPKFTPDLNNSIWELVYDSVNLTLFRRNLKA